MRGWNRSCGLLLPSSEMLRVRVLAENGDVVWRSDEDIAFLALVSLVQPQTAGRLHVYEMPWNGRTSAGKQMRAGTYRAEFIIPARPNEYVAFLDFTEECVRLRSHIKHFQQYMTTEKQPGRKLNFLVQEMNREINTIGSKCNDAEIAMTVVTMKEELERIREQIQNVE